MIFKNVSCVCGDNGIQWWVVPYDISVSWMVWIFLIYIYIYIYVSM